MHGLVSGTVDDRGRSCGTEPASRAREIGCLHAAEAALRPLEVVNFWASPSRDFQTCSQRRFQHQSPLWDRCLGHGANLFHDAFYKVVEDLQLAVERPNELFIRLNSHDNLWKHVMPADDIDPAALRNVELTLKLWSKAFIHFSRNPIFDLSVRQRGLDLQ